MWLQSCLYFCLLVCCWFVVGYHSAVDDLSKLWLRFSTIGTLIDDYCSIKLMNAGAVVVLYRKFGFCAEVTVAKVANTGNHIKPFVYFWVQSGCDNSNLRKSVSDRMHSDLGH